MCEGLRLAGLGVFFSFPGDGARGFGVLSRVDFCSAGEGLFASQSKYWPCLSGSFLSFRVEAEREGLC